MSNVPLPHVKTRAEWGLLALRGGGTPAGEYEWRLREGRCWGGGEGVLASGGVDSLSWYADQLWRNFILWVTNSL